MTFELRKNCAQYFLFLFVTWSLVLVGIIYGTLRPREGHIVGWEDIALISLYSTICWVPLFVIVDYFIEDYSKKIVVENDIITIFKSKRKTVFKKSEIKHIFLIRGKNSGKVTMASFKYFIIILKTGDFIYVTTLICSSRKFIHEIGLPVEEIIVFFPYIDKAIGKGDLS